VVAHIPEVCGNVQKLATGDVHAHPLFKKCYSQSKILPNRTGLLHAQANSNK